MADQADLLQRAFNAGKVAQALFYVVIENTWTLDMENIRIVRNEDGTLLATEVVTGPGEQTGPGGESTCERDAGGWLVRFPFAEFNKEDDVIKHALLADQNSLWAFIIMHVAVQVLFEDLVNDVTEDIIEVLNLLPPNISHIIQYTNYFGVRNVKRRDLAYPDDDESGTYKGYYQIKLKDNTEIALDLTGAQYQIGHNTVMPLAAYLDLWGRLTEYRVPFRSHYHKHMKIMGKYRCVTHLTIFMKQLAYFNAFVTRSENTLGFSIKNMLDFELEDFNNGLVQVLDQTDLHLQAPCMDINSGMQFTYSSKTFDLRHPRIAGALPKPTASSAKKEDEEEAILKSTLIDLDPLKYFNWDKLRGFIRLTGKDVKYKEKKKIQALLSHRCVYKVPGDWKLVFLKDTLPSKNVLEENMSKNWYWKGYGEERNR